MDNVSATTLTWKLKAIQDTPAEVDGKLLALRYVADRYKPTVSVNPVA